METAGGRGRTDDRRHPIWRIEIARGHTAAAGSIKPALYNLYHNGLKISLEIFNLH